jgi:thiamine kinase-like enzyme
MPREHPADLSITAGRSLLSDACQPISAGSGAELGYAPMEVELVSASVLDRVPGWAGRTGTVQPLAGITNRNYRVVVGDEAFVLRIPAAQGGLLGIDRRIEYQASRLAAQAGIGPEVVAFIEPEGYLVTRFIEGQPVSDQMVHDPAMLSRIADSIRRIHQAGRVAAAFSPFRAVQDYAAAVIRHGGSLPPAYEQARPIAADIERALSSDPVVLCHNDLLNANFIDDGTRIRIIDWEYAGMGDRFFDFGNFAVNHQLNKTDESCFLGAYFGQVTESDHARVKLMRLMSDFREAMWGVLQQAISELDIDFAAYAAKHFNRFFESAADPHYRDWLKQAAR